MTADEMKALRELEAKATPRPWDAYSAPWDASAMCCPDMGGIGGPNGRVCADKTGRYRHPMTIENAKLAVAARNALPALLDEVERLRAQVEALKRENYDLRDGQFARDLAGACACCVEYECDCLEDVRAALEEEP